ncbi:hypothetical protein [Actinomadura rugatobispora]|uniref:Uncharacterized protein n=1 Tax=Actinomadura rugatobispora TaxID=1994 RepID=A0ABW1AJR0_9ACTN|nr:hypothetical protein GCM10010200_030010 [Actinomadura rugatobispora]
MNRSLQELPTPPAWISKPLYAMTPDELRDLHAALCRETPPDAALLRAVDRCLALFAPPPAALPRPPAAVTPADDEEDEDDSWALDG